ncbi:zinc finger protein 64, partial [Bicyclus anynana]|uniref:Zinc finger protein 64 n=1 Tax=Bicyclus anynana TaxID=110368 RepID=A0A6J1N0U1_BICAN
MEDIATVVVKKEDNSGNISTAMRLIFEDDNFIDNDNNGCISSDEARLLDNATCEDLHRKTLASCTTVTEHVTETQIVKCEIFKCTLCSEDFTQEIELNLHMIMHCQNGDSDAAYDKYQVCKPHSAAGCSLDSPVVKNETGLQKLNDDLPSAALAPASDAPLAARLAQNNEYGVEATKVTGLIEKSEQILESNIATKTYTDISSYTNCVVRLYDILKHPKKTAPDDNSRVSARSGAKRYSCELCHYKSTYKCQILLHIRTHTGEKPFPCELCNKKFSIRRNFLQHMRVHRGEKSNFCKICDFKCADRSALVRHIRTH